MAQEQSRNLVSNQMNSIKFELLWFFNLSDTPMITLIVARMYGRYVLVLCTIYKNNCRRCFLFLNIPHCLLWTIIVVWTRTFWCRTRCFHWTTAFFQFDWIKCKATSSLTFHSCLGQQWFYPYIIKESYYKLHTCIWPCLHSANSNLINFGRTQNTDMYQLHSTNLAEWSIVFIKPVGH